MDKLEDDWKALKFWFFKTLRLFRVRFCLLYIYRAFDIMLGRRDWLIGVDGWVVGRASCVLGSALCVVRRASCVVRNSSYLFEETLAHTTLRIHEKVSPIKISKANLSVKYVLFAGYVLPGPLPFSRMFLAHSAFWVLMKCTCAH